jgi:hypothetical protein
MLQQAARQRTGSHNVHRMRDVAASANLQEVAVKGSNVEREHAPKHALNFGLPHAIRIRGIGLKVLDHRATLTHI